MKNYFLLLWIEYKNNISKRRHAWFDNSADALRNYRIALESNCVDVIVIQVNAENIDRIRMICDGSPI